MKFVSKENLSLFSAKFKNWVNSRKIKSSDIDSTGATSGQVPTADGSGGATWATPSAGMSNPMTTQGDIIVGGASGAATRLAKGSAGQFLVMNAGGTAPEWQTVPDANGQSF